MNKKCLPKITIAIAAYNAEKTIKRAICSAIAQDWDDFEILVVDDSSIDATSNILTDISATDERILFFQNESNRGIGAVRNILVEKASGVFIAFFDDDDESVPSRIRTQYERIIAYEEEIGTDMVICFTAREQIEENGKGTYEPTLGLDKTPGVFGDAVAELILTGKPIPGERGSMATCSKMVRREVFERVGGYDIHLRRSEDTEFNLRFAILGGHFAGISVPLVKQYKTYTHDKSFEEERHNFFYLLEKHRGYLEKRKLYSFTIKWFEMKFALLAGNKLQFIGGVLKLFFFYPRKLLEKISWSLPNLGQYVRTIGKNRKQAGEQE